MTARSQRLRILRITDAPSKQNSANLVTASRPQQVIVYLTDAPFDHRGGSCPAAASSLGAHPRCDTGRITALSNAGLDWVVGRASIGAAPGYHSQLVDGVVRLTLRAPHIESAIALECFQVCLD